MTLTPEQKQTVASWVAAGDNLSAVQKKLAEQFQLSMTYRDVRFLVDDLNLELKDPVPPAPPADPCPAPEKKGFLDKAKEKLGLGKGESDPASEEDQEKLSPAEAGNVQIEVDKVNLIPGALASGSVTFSDGVTGRWIVDQYGRPGFSEISQPGYRPTPADGQAFMQELSLALQNRGL